MSNKEIITEIIEDLEQTVGLNWPRKCKVNKEKLIECWEEHRLCPDFEFYGYAHATSLSKIYRKIFSNIDKKSNKKTWKLFILEMYNFKYCSSCKELLSIEDFHTYKYESRCKYCISKKSNIYNIKRLIKLKERTPKWGDNSAIKKIYRHCPEGYHVDHVIPLQGELVSGLHVAENLQYLTALDNLAKSNKFEVT